VFSANIHIRSTQVASQSKLVVLILHRQITMSVIQPGLLGQPVTRRLLAIASWHKLHLIAIWALASAAFELCRQLIRDEGASRMWSA
jgi:hypothetical protein